MAIRHKRKNSAGYTWQTGDLVEGQIGLNIADGTLHFDKADGSTVTISPNTNTTYAISAETNAAGADLRLTGSDAATDNVTIAAGTNVTVTRTDANTITIAATAGGTVAETLRTGVYNADSVTLTKGMPVYVFGAQGQQISVKRAINTGDAGSAQTLGLVEADIAAGAEGYVVTFGEVTNINTDGYTEGAPFYLGSTAGTITFTKPYAPNHMVYLGFVEKANASSGRLFVKVQNGYELDELHNVNIDHNVASANKDYLVYNSSNSLWENRQLDIVNDTTPQLGGNLDVQANIITTSTTNGNITITPDGTGDVILSADTVQIGDSGAGATLTTNGAGNLLLNTNGGTNSGSIQINQGAAGNIVITPDTTGDIFLQGDTLYVGDTGVTANIFSQGAADLVLGTNSGAGGGITVGGTASSPITLEPNGTGDVNLNADTVRVGDSGAAATITTNGAGNLTLNTNAGTNSGSIAIAAGVNGAIALTCNGSGSIVFQSPSVGVITTTTANTPVIRARHIVTSSATDNLPGFDSQKHRTDILLSAMTDEPASYGFSVRDSSNTNRTFGRWIGRYLGSATNPTYSLRGSPDGFTTNLHYLTFGAGVGTFGSTSSTYTITSNTGGNLVLTANNNTTSGTITVASGANGNITITPNGTGNIVLEGVNWPQADGTNGQVLTTNGSGQASWTTPSGGSSSIQVAIAYASTTFYTGTKYLNWNSEASDINGLITVGSNGTFTISSAGTYLIELPSIFTHGDRNAWELYDQTGSAVLKSFTAGSAATDGNAIVGGWCFIHVITASNIYRWQCPSTGVSSVTGTPQLKVTKLA